MTNSTTVLSVNNIEVIYDHVILVLKGVSLDVPDGVLLPYWEPMVQVKQPRSRRYQTCCASERGEVTKGSIEYLGDRVDALNPAELVERGVIQVMEGRHCFEHLTVEENLMTGAYTRKDGRKAIADDLEMVYSYFPRLKERRRSQAGYTSGASNKWWQLQSTYGQA